MTEMEHRRVGSSGLQVSAIALGGWLTLGKSVDDTRASRIVERAVELGVTFIDLADAYAKGEAERTFGLILKGLRRSSLVVSSKLYWPMGPLPNDRGLSRKHVIESCHASLTRLGTDYLDLYFCHREDPDTPLEETARAMEDLIRQGKVLYWGTSCFRASTLLKAHALAGLRGGYAPIVEQPQYNLLERSVEKRVMPIARRLGMGIVAWSPLAGGALTGKYDDEIPKDSRASTSPDTMEAYLTDTMRPRLRRFSAIARELGHAPSQLALAWCLRRPEIASVITGATNVEQLEQNVGALGVKIPDDVARELDALFPRQGAR
jgi:voltage-dependent potassium channel beta subunit